MLKIKTENPSLMAILVLLSLTWMALSPLAVIWALNTVFMLEIPFTFWTWLGIAIIGGFLHTYSSSN